MMNTTSMETAVCTSSTTGAGKVHEKGEHPQQQKETFFVYSTTAGKGGIQMAAVGEPILPRIDRLDNLLRHLEDMRNRRPWSPTKSSCASTPTSGALTSEFGRNSSFDDSPRVGKVKQQCRSINDAIYETERKGTLLQRLDLLEDRVLKVCMELERNDVEAGKERGGGDQQTAIAPMKKQKKKKSGLKQLVKSCVTGGTSAKAKNSKSNRR